MMRLTGPPSPPFPVQVVIGTHGRMKNWVSYRQLEIENVVILVFDEADEMLKADAFADDTGMGGKADGWVVVGLCKIVMTQLLLSCTGAYCIDLLVGWCKVKHRQQAVLIDTVSAWRFSGQFVWRGGVSVILLC